MNVVVDMGMVNIESKNISYGNIRNMYKENRNGAGIQLAPELESKRDDISDVCDKIASLFYQLEDLT
ncbi:MAG TPA: hypothetical protein VGD04_10300 [Methylophilus sp.]